MSRAGHARSRARQKPDLTLTPVAKHTTKATGQRVVDVLDRAGIPRQYLHQYGGWCFPTAKSADVVAAARSLGGTAADGTGVLW